MSINDNNEGYYQMKDIIVAQQIARRPGLSILSTVLYPPILQDNSFIVDQHLRKREKKPLFERERGSNRDNGLSFSKPIPEHILHERFMPEYILPERSLPEQFDQCRRSVLQAVAAALYARKKLVAIILLCLAAGCLAFVNYIPDPEPPEDSLVKENSTRWVSADLSNAGDEIPLDLTEVFAWQSYTVKYGDSVEGIARRFGLSLDAVIASNNLRNVRQLRAGDHIRIPNIDGIPYTVKNGDSYAGIASAQKVPLEAILDANDIQSDEIMAGTVLFIPGAKMDKTALRQALGTFFIWPLIGKRSSPFGWRDDPYTGARSFHAGLDISIPMGTPVKASSDGKVSATGFNAVYGNFLIISHTNDYQTMYAHLNRILVKTGAYVNQGSVIARSGNSGRSTGPHLHFSVYKNKRAINPLDVVNK
jgi:murein DD-endopeptidase MepM/ murein hydrolase activator NlpD